LALFFCCAQIGIVGDRFTLFLCAGHTPFGAFLFARFSFGHFLNRTRVNRALTITIFSQCLRADRHVRAPMPTLIVGEPAGHVGVVVGVPVDGQRSR
jgi:hypothetical protein